MGRFHPLAVVTNAAMNKGVQDLFPTLLSACVSVPRSGIAGPYGDSVNLLRNSQTVSNQQHPAVPIFPLPTLILRVVGCFFIMTI